MNRLISLALVLALVGSACAGDTPTVPEPEPTATEVAPATTVPAPGAEPDPDEDLRPEPATPETHSAAAQPPVPTPPVKPAFVEPEVDEEETEPPASEIADEPPADPAQPGSPAEPGDGVILGEITPDGRPDNGRPGDRHLGDRTIAVYVERELAVDETHLRTWLRRWNAQRSVEGRWPYFIRATYVDDCRWRGTGTLTVCALNDAEMTRIAGKPFTGLAKAKQVDEKNKHTIGGAAVLLNFDRLPAGFNKVRVLNHEWGHVLGLGHQGANFNCGPESDPASLMSYCPNSNHFDDDDVAALNRLYAH